MIAKPYTELMPEKVEMEGTLNTTIRWLVAAKDGAPNFSCGCLKWHPVATHHLTVTRGNTKFSSWKAKGT